MVVISDGAEGNLSRTLSFNLSTPAARLIPALPSVAADP